MPDYASLFTYQSEKYEKMVSYEDYENNLLSTIESIILLSKSLTVADIGAGTGRISFILSPYVSKIYGIEPNESMRQTGIEKARNNNIKNIEFISGGYELIPLKDKICDFVIEGWSLLYYYKLSQPDWKRKISNAIAEMKRILKDNGKMILIETLGTMQEGPIIMEFASPLYNFLEDELKFKKIEIRTDYKFENVGQAIELITFFFGNEMGNEVRKSNISIIPEYTGIWHRNF